MKILQVITSLRTGGAEKLIVDMVPLYLEKGLNVDVLLFDGVETDFKRMLLSKGVRIIDLSKGGFIYNPIYILKLIPYIRKYDIIHAHLSVCQLFVAIAGLFTSCILVTTEHNTFNRKRTLWFYRFIDKWMYRQYKSIVCISEMAKANLNKFIGNNNIITINNGINCSLYHNANENYSLKSKKFIVTMVAAFRDQKDQDTLIKAFQYLPEELFELWLVGDGSRKNELLTLVGELKLQKTIKFWGVRNDIPVLLKTSDVVVLSSHWEGFGLAAVEGMAAGKPVVVTDVPGLAQVVDGAGILFPHENAKDLASIILKLRNDQKYYRRIAEQCFKRASDFDIHKTVDNYVKLYKLVCR